MKFLKYLLFLIIVLVVIFFGRGLLTPSVYYESEVIVDKSAKEAWAVMSDETNLPKWIEGFKKTELISGEANKVGAVSKVYVDNNGQETVMEETIKAVNPPELLNMTFTMDLMNMDYEILFKEDGDKTVITSKSTTMGNGLFYKSFISFIQGAMKAQEDVNLNSLRELINENKKNYFPEVQIETPEVMVN